MREELDRGLAQLGVTHSARQSEELLARSEEHTSELQSPA